MALAGEIKQHFMGTPQILIKSYPLNIDFETMVD